MRRGLNKLFLENVVKDRMDQYTIGGISDISSNSNI